MTHPRIAVTEVFPCRKGASVLLPLFLSRVAASFPSPADDYVDRPLDLNELLIRHQSATFFVRAQGDSMTGAGIHDGDLMVVDRALEPVNGHIVVAALNGELTVKQFFRRGRRLRLVAANDRYPPIEVTPETEVVVWGVVTHVIHTLAGRKALR